MMTVDSPTRPQETIEMDLHSLIHLRTGRQISGLHVEVSQGHVVLHGRAHSFYVKQIAQHCVLDSLPNTHLTNDIIVEGCRSGPV
jgi:osmotically-inducible protein OsmY